MTDDDTPAPAAGDADEGARVLEEQRARIAALRAAVLSGQVPEDGAFDYEGFLGGPARGDAPKD